MPNHHTPDGKTQNKTQSLIFPLVLSSSVSRSPALPVPQACVEAPGGSCTGTGRCLSAGFAQHGLEKRWPEHRLHLTEQLCGHANPMTQVGDYLLLASLCCQGASTDISVLLFQTCTARDSPSQAGGRQRGENCLAKGHTANRARRKTSILRVQPAGQPASHPRVTSAKSGEDVSNSVLTAPMNTSFKAETQ